MTSKFRNDKWKDVWRPLKDSAVQSATVLSFCKKKSNVSYCLSFNVINVCVTYTCIHVHSYTCI